MYQIFAAYALLSSAISTNKFILKVLPAGLFVGLRMFIAGLLLVAWRSKKNSRFSWAYLKQDLPLFATISIFTTCIPSLLKAYGLKHMVSSKAAFLGSLDPFITAFYDYIFWQRTLTARQLLGICVGIFGVALHIVTTAQEENNLIAFGVLSYPELAALGSMAIGRLGWMLVQHLARSNRYQPSEITGITMLLSGIVTITTAATYERCELLMPIFTPLVAMLVVYTILAGNIVGYSLYTQALKEHSATLVSLCGICVPLFVYLYGGIFLGESFGSMFLVSFPITALGMLIFYSDKKQGLKLNTV